MNLAARVAKLEAEAATLRSQLLLLTRGAAGGLLTVRQACEMLAIGRTKLGEYIARELLIPVRHAGKGRGKRVYLHSANVQALLESEDAAREWVARRKYVPLKLRKESIA